MPLFLVRRLVFVVHALVLAISLGFVVELGVSLLCLSFFLIFFLLFFS